MGRKTVVVLSLLAVLTLAGMFKGGALGEGTTASETITYKAKDVSAPIGTEANPFTVLEIVPSEQMAAMGYLISGCEPVDITDNTSAMGVYRQVYGDYDGTNYGKDGIAQVDIVTHPAFAWDLGEDVSKSDPIENDPTKSGFHFGQHGYFERVADGTGRYEYVENGVEKSIEGYFKPVDDNRGDYNWVPLISYEQSEAQPENSIGTYYLKGEKYTEEERKDGDGEYFSFEWATIAGENMFYAIPLVEDYEDYSLENNEGLALTKEQLDNGNIAVGMRFYQDRYEEIYYFSVQYEIRHKNQLIQTLFPMCESPETFVSQVITVTPEQLKGSNVTGDETIIKSADMIVIHDSTVAKAVNAAAGLEGQAGDAENFTSKDIDNDCFNALIHKQASGNPAILWMDSGAMTGLSNAMNLRKLHTVLNQMSAKYYYNVYCNSQETDAGGKPLWQAEKDPNAAGIYTVSVNKTGTFLGASSFVLNWNADEFLKNLISEDDRLSDDGDTTILSAISKMYGTTKGVVYDADGSVTALLKKEWNILELQPIAKFKYEEANWRSFYMDLLPDDFVGTGTNIADDMHVTTMATYEFNGKIEELNSTYDMIYLGASQDATNGANGYNDAALGKLAYTTVGDLVSTDTGKTYFVDYERFRDVCNFDRPDRYKSDNFHWISGTIDAWNYSTSQSASFIGANKGSDLSQCNTRYSGTDVTEKRYEELLDFSLKHPIIVDNRLYKTPKEVDDTFVDSSSFVYNIAQFATLSLGNDQPFIKRYDDVRRNATAPKSKVLAYTAKALKTSCEMVFSAETASPNREQGQDGRPVAYTYQEKDAAKKTIEKGTISNNNQKDEDDNNVLRYHFTLYGDSASEYRVRLGIDSNGNGSFEGSEWKEDLHIVDETTEGIGQQVVDQSKGGTLQAGHTYTVTRILPVTEVGMLPWKLQVYNTQTASIRDSEMGYTRIAGGEKTTINVLQMNLTSNDDMNQNRKTNINFADETSSVGKRFREYLDGVEDYDIRVTFLQNEDFYRTYGKDNKAKAWTEYLMGYDMLILGFQDSASFSDNPVFLEGFKAFVNAGKSVMLSHDMVYDRSFCYPKGEFDGNFLFGWQYSEDRYSSWEVNEDASAYLRELSGQAQRYYAMDPVDSKPIGSYTTTYSRGKKISMMPRADLEVAYLYRWARSGIIFGNWEFQTDPNKYSWMDQTDYRYRLPGAREYACSLMDNSVRAMIFASRIKASDKIDRVLTNPSKNNASIAKSTLAWTDSCTTKTVKVANQGQITNYPFAMADTITVGETHTQNFRLDLEAGETSGFDGFFNINGEYSEWNEVPKTEGSWWTDAPNKNRGTIVYDRGLAYGYAETNEPGSMDSNGSSFKAMRIIIEQEDGKSQAYEVDVIAVTENGAVTLHPPMDNLAPGDYKFYLVSTGFSSDNIYNLKRNPYWNDDMIWGEMIMHITDGPDRVEYSLDVDAITRWDRQNPMDVTKVSNVTSIMYGISSADGTPPSCSSKDTDNFVTSLGATKRDGAIVWYNLSNGAGDSTNIYSAKEGDSANNYFIYTKDNVTYSGVGHSGDMTDDEIRLFINTMISSYRSVADAPYPTCVNEDAIRNGKLYTLYGEEVGGEVLQDVTVYLRANDDSVQATYQNYTMIVRDSDGNVVHQASRLAKGAITSFVVDRAELQDKKRLNYTVDLVATGNNNTSTQSITVRVMTMPLFGLD